MTGITKVRPRTIIERNPESLLSYFDDLINLSDNERNALGFLPRAAYQEAIAQKRLIAMLAIDDNQHRSLVGYLLHGGVFPHARVQQICTHPEWRRHKIASALIDAFVSDLERAGFSTVKAKVADDLTYAQSFYASQGFKTTSLLPGGASRGRTIHVRVRNLDTPDLFSHDATKNSPSFGQRRSNELPSYSFDLNVLFDLIKTRERYENACVLFSAAFDHRIRLAIAPEFITELQRNSKDKSNDVVLQMALRLPQLSLSATKHEVSQLAEKIHEIVFIRSRLASAGSKQALSDAKHLAQSASAGVSAFITSDNAILEARDQLLDQVGIDVASLDELLSLLPDPSETKPFENRQGNGFECREPGADEAAKYLDDQSVPTKLIEETCSTFSTRHKIWRTAIWVDKEIVALACLANAPTAAGEARLLVFVQPGHLDRELYADYLLDAAIKQGSLTGPTTIRLLALSGQAAVRTSAKTRGFTKNSSNDDLIKIAFNLPLTQSNWNDTRNLIRRRTGLSLPMHWPKVLGGNQHLDITNDAGSTYSFAPEYFEDIFSPTLLLWPDRECVIVPIKRTYANDLLGTNDQSRLPFIVDRDASFLSRRAYINTPRARNAMRPGLPILFYESGQNGGRKAILAVARIVDSVLMSASSTSQETTRKIVVDDMSKFSVTEEVLLTTFDNLMLLPNPVPYAKLKEIGAADFGNFISAVKLPYKFLAKIIEAGWTK